MIDFVKMGERIAEYRRKLGLSQEELADRLFVTRQALSKWECGTSIPSIDSLHELSLIFSVSFEEILGLFESPEIIDSEDIFKGHDRGYVLEKIALGEISVKVPDVLYQMSPAERLYILKKIKSGELKVDSEELYAKLTPSEMRFLKGE